MGFLRRLRKCRGQNAAEYALVFALVIGAAVAVQGVVKNGVHNRIVGEMTKLADGASASSTMTFSLDSESHTSRVGDDTTDVREGGAVDVDSVSNVTRDSTETYTAGY